MTSTSSTAPARALTLDNEDSDMSTQPMLWYLVERDASPISIDYVPNMKIDILKRIIASNNLILWKANITIPVANVDAMYYSDDVGRTKGNGNNFLRPNIATSHYIPEKDLKNDHIQVVVELPKQ
ncbi:hypothetical protein BGX20_005968, partial [Mortierella sp. AD010]